MKVPIPLLLITVLQGLGGGMAVMLAARLAAGASVGLGAYGLAFGLVGIGAIASFTHIHQIRAARYMLRGWRTSWLSREAVTTAGFIAALAVEMAGMRYAGPVAPVAGWGIVTAGLGLLAMWVTAMLYATIPAMMSWHGPLTVVSLMWTGLAGGWMVALAVTGGNAWQTPVGLALLCLWAVFRALQARMFSAARRRIRGTTGAGLPLGPYRLQDTGTTKAPYRTQTQIAPDMPEHVRWTALVLAYGWMLAVPVGLLGVAGGAGRFHGMVALMALSIVAGSFMDRWIFFRDAVHSSRVWFADPPAIRKRVGEYRAH